MTEDTATTTPLTNTYENGPPLSQSPTTGKIALALSCVQGNLTHAVMKHEGQIPTKNGGSYSFKYADLKTIIDLARPFIAAQELFVAQRPITEPNGARVHTVIYHSSGEFIADGGMFIPVARRDDPKAFGSAYTYARRYSLACLLGIAQEDDDGEAASKPAAATRAKPKGHAEKTKLAPIAKRDVLETMIKELPDEFRSQIGDRLRAQAIVWTQLTPEQLKEITEWYDECKAFADAAK